MTVFNPSLNINGKNGLTVSSGLQGQLFNESAQHPEVYKRTL